MTIHQCPKCELRFEWKTELDDHCWHDHPEFRHDYPAAPVPAEVPVEAKPHEPAHHEPRHTHIGASSFGAWLQPTRPRESGERRRSGERRESGEQPESGER